MLFSKKKNIKKSPELRYIMNFLAHDRYTLAEYYDGGFAETTLDVRREDDGFYLEKTVHRYNAGKTDTHRVSLVPFDTFDAFFTQLEAFCGDLSLDKARLRENFQLMRFLSLYQFIFLQGSDNGAEFVDGNIIIMESTPHIIRKDAEPIRTTWTQVKELAETSRSSTGLWIRNLDDRNWESYTFALYSWWKPVKPRRVTEWFFRDTRDETSIWKDFVMNCIVRDRETGEYYLSHEVADGYGADHYPRWIYHHIPISAQEVARLEAAGLLMPGPGY